MRGLAKAVLCVGMFVGVLGVDFGTEKLHDAMKRRAEKQRQERLEKQHLLDKKQAKQKLTVEYGASPLRSEAIFILPSASKGEGDSINKARAYQIRDAFIDNGVPAYIVGDTSGHGSVESIDSTIKAIQKECRYQAVTVLSLTHGCVYDLKTAWVFKEKGVINRENAWSEHRDQTGHLTSIAAQRDQPSTQDLMASMASAAQVKKMDWVSFECFAGAQRQAEIDVLPNQSMFVAMSGGNQANFNDADLRLLEALQAHKLQFDEGFDAPDLLVEALAENIRHYKADIVIGVSGGTDLAVIPSDNKYTTSDLAGAMANNHQQLERAKRVHLRPVRH